MPVVHVSFLQFMSIFRWRIFWSCDG